MKLYELVEYLDAYLKIDEVLDAPHALNGLQVEGVRGVRTIATATDACTATVEEAVRAGADLLLVHHGLFWSGLQPLTGPRYRTFKALIENGMSLYSAHLPLDVHPEVGNNAVLLERLGFEAVGGFGTEGALKIGLWSEVDVSRAELIRRVRAQLGDPVLVLAKGPDHVGKLGLVTGGGGKFIDEAHERGLDTFITGEAKHPHAVAAEEYGINLILGGHYATETLGVRALGDHLAQKFGVAHRFIDHPFPT